MTERDELRASLEARRTEELVSILRNRDEEQWRPEVFDVVGSILAARGLSAADVAALGPEGIDVVEGRPLATVGRYFSPVEAHAARLALEAAGLPAWVTDESLGTIYGVGVGARLQVRLEDEGEAQRILEESAVPAEALPPEQAEAPCPKCGSRQVSQESELIEDQTAPSSSLRAGRKWTCQCEACGHRWPADD